MSRDYAAELRAARDAEDWDAHARIWEERRVGAVVQDEAAIRDPIDWTGVREIHRRRDEQNLLTGAMDVMFPYRLWSDDPNAVRGNAQRIIEQAINYRTIGS